MIVVVLAGYSGKSTAMALRYARRDQLLGTG
jgi:hypothetical protein